MFSQVLTTAWLGSLEYHLTKTFQTHLFVLSVSSRQKGCNYALLDLTEMYTSLIAFQKHLFSDEQNE